MLTHYLTIAWRRLRQQRLSGTLSLAGLSLAIAYALLALTYVRQELTYDAFHAKANRIYQVVQAHGLYAGREVTFTPRDLGPEQVRGCAIVVRMVRMTKVLLQVGHSLAASEQWVPLLCADPEILEVFDLPLRKANSLQPLAEANGVVLTESAARRWFPHLDPLGRILRVYTRRYDTAGFGRYDLEPHSLTVTGVLRDLPPNSSLTFDLLLPRATAQRLGLGGVEGLFVELTPDADPRAVAAELSGLAARNGQGPSTKPDYRLQPLRSLHFGKEEYDQLGSAPAGRLRHVAILAGMAALVLLVAILAHAVLATAQTGVRIREIGVRKAVGATVGQVRCQFWGESVVMSFLGLGIGLVLAWVMAGPFGALVDRRIEVLGQLPGDLLGSFGLALVTGLLAGWYPALVLSRSTPTDVLRGTRSGRGRGRFSHGLMVVQLGLCVFLAVCVVVMAAQLLFLQRKDLGFDGDHVVAVPLGNNGTPEVVQAFRHRLRGAEGVVAVSATEHAPNISSLVATWRYSNEEVLLQGFRVDTGFMEAMGLRLVAGRWLDPTQDTPTGSVVVNETLVRRLGWSNPVGRRLDGLNPGPHGLGGFGLEEPVVVGVVQDFHTGEISRAIRPAVLRLPDRGVGFKALIVRLDPERMGAGLAAVQRVWREVAGKAEYRGFVLGEYLDGQGANTARWARLVRWSAGVALLIAGLSVFGLAAVEADRRTREIGVRKVMGASVPRLVALLLWDFTKPVLAANLVAWPAAWLAMETWLGSFAYHVPLRPGYFLLAGLAGVLIAWLTGAWHAVRVARANPMEALRQADG